MEQAKTKTSKEEEFDPYSPVDDFEEYEGKSKDELKRLAVREFDLDENELSKKVELEPKFSKETKDEMANIEFFAEKLEMGLTGKSLIKTGKNEEKYVQTGKAMVGETYIRSIVGIIKTFANKSMLIGEKEEKIFYMQFEDAWYKVSDALMERKHNIDVISARTILKQVKDTFWNLGGILLVTRGNMKTWFGTLDEKYGELDDRIRSKLGD